MKKLLSLALALTVALSLLVVGGCDQGGDGGGGAVTPPTYDWGVFTEDDFIKADGKVLKTAAGEVLTLRGINIGGYLVTEQWMCGFRGSNNQYTDHKDLTEVFVKRFGAEEAVKLWTYYRENFWTEADVENCQKMGMNSIRLPFSYMNVDPQYNNVPEIKGQKYNFTVLDEFVELAAQYGIYTILDLHGAYGSQNGQDHSGESLNLEQVDFYNNEENKQKTADLWRALAEHFEGNPAVAGYDILNEPGEKAGTTKDYHWDYFDVLYDAIREVDKDHVVIIESCWDGNNLPQPSKYGWQNVMYSFHNYTGHHDDVNAHLNHMQNKIDGVRKQNFNVPIYMGEFTCYGQEQAWKKTLSLFNSYGWSWASWTYKLSNTGYDGWAICYASAERIYADRDSLEEIYDKMYYLDTNCESSSMYRFSSGNTLFNIMKAGCTEKVNYYA